MRRLRHGALLSLVGLAGFAAGLLAATRRAAETPAPFQAPGAPSHSPAPEVQVPFQAPEVPAARNPCLKYLPEDSWLVGNLDCRAALEAAARMHAESQKRQQESGYAMLQQYLRMIQAMTGIDLEKEVQYLTFFVTGDDASPKFLLVATGSFENDTAAGCLARLAGDGVKKSAHGDVTVYEQAGGAYCFPAPSTLVFGITALVEGAAARVAKPAPIPPALDRTLALTNGRSVVWVACRPKAILDGAALAEWREQQAAFYQVFSPIECASAYFEVATDGFLVTALAHLPDADKATRLATYLRDRQRALLHTEGSNVLLCSFLLLSDLTADGCFVKGSVHLTASALKGWWNTKVILKPQDPP